MNKFFMTFTFFVLVILLTGCGSNMTLQAGNTPTSGAEDNDFTAYDVLTADNDIIYKPNDIVRFQVMKSDTSNTIASKNIDGLGIVCIKDNDGNYYAALSDGEDGGYYNCFLQIGDAEYPYEDTVEIFEYSGALNHSGFILSFVAGANSKDILYFYVKEDIPVLLAECNKSNYEIDFDDEGNRKLITTFGSAISETMIYYNISDQIYKLNMNAFVYDTFCADNETVSVTYDGAEDKFTINICSRDNLTDVSSKKAYIDGNTLYVS